MEHLISTLFMALEQQHVTSHAFAASALRSMLKCLDSRAALSRKINKGFNDFPALLCNYVIPKFLNTIIYL